MKVAEEIRSAAHSPSARATTTTADLTAAVPYAPSTFHAFTFFDAVPRFRSGADTPRAYLERCLEIIAVRDSIVRAWVTLNETEARRAADAATERYRTGRPLSPIDGMPIGIKDLIETKDMPTQMGCAAFAGNFPKRDSACVRALRTAGAIILGKTVTTEFGYAHPGPTTNPFNPRHTPGGSSSGSAAAVGAGMVPAALGTQVGGSIIRPASFCANYAIKPTFGALNRGERLGYSQSHMGVHAGSLADMWQVAIEIAERAGGDPGHPGLSGPRDLPASTKPKRLAVMETEGWAVLDSLSREAFEQVLESLRGQGVAVLRRAEASALAEFERSVANAKAVTRDICAFEARWVLENLHEQNPGTLSAALTAQLARGRALTVDDYRACLLVREKARQQLAAIAPLADALISLSSAGPAPAEPSVPTGDASATRPTGDSAFNVATSVLGAPTVSVPLMAVGGLPVGVQIIAQAHADAHAVAIARWVSETISPVTR